MEGIHPVWFGVTVLVSGMVGIISGTLSTKALDGRVAHPASAPPNIGRVQADMTRLGVDDWSVVCTYSKNPNEPLRQSCNVVYETKTKKGAK